MTVHVRFRDIENVDKLKAQIERKVGFATDRFAVRLVGIHVAVSDVNGPRGGVDKRCSIRGVLEGGRAITVEERGADAIAVVNRAVRRLSNCIGRILVRARRGRTPVMKPSRSLILFWVSSNVRERHGRQVSSRNTDETTRRF